MTLVTGGTSCSGSTSVSQASCWCEMADRFEAYSLTHAVVVVVSAVVVAGLVSIGRRWRKKTKGRQLDKTLAGVAALTWVGTLLYLWMPGRASLKVSLPLHVTDVTLLAIVVVLLTRWRAARAIVYFWGLGLATQAYVTPVLWAGPGRIAFWGFWIGHLVILAVPVYDVAVRGFRPTWRDYGVALAALVLYAIVVIPVNLLVGGNYGFIGPDLPGRPTLMDHLGDWPMRLVPLFGLAVIGLALPMLPWTIGRRSGWCTTK